MTTLMERKIIQIDEEKCNGCGLCVHACHEGAIQMIDGKAKLVSDIYCDGLGDCLGPCPTGAISIISRPAEAYDEQAVAERMAAMKTSGSGCPGSAAKTLKPASAGIPFSGGCPGSAARALKPESASQLKVLDCGCPGSMSRSLKEPEACACADQSASQPSVESELMNWPVQLRLVPPGAPYLQGADILLAADCSAFAVPDFHTRYLKNKPVIIACPKLEDNEPQIAKMAEVFRVAKPSSLTVLRMEVPCCGGLARIAEEAAARSGVNVPIKTVIVSVDGTEM